MDFAGHMPPGLDFDGQENDGMSAIANAAIGDNVSVPETLGTMLEQARAPEQLQSYLYLLPLEVT